MRGLPIPDRLLAWGASTAERDAQHPADRHVPAGGEHLVRAIDIDDAPPALRFVERETVATRRCFATATGAGRAGEL